MAGRRLRVTGERGHGAIEYAGWAFAAGLLLIILAYAVLQHTDKASGRRFTPAEQAYIQAVATQEAEATQQASLPPPAAPAAEQAAAYVAAQEAPAAPPPAVVAPTDPPPPPPPPPPPTSTPLPPAPPPPPPPTTAPPPPTGATTPMARCVGYMAGFSSLGLTDCQAIAAGPDQTLGKCVGDIIAGAGTSPAGKADCVQAALHVGGLLSDCLLNLSGQSHFGATSCRLYYQAG